MLYALTLLIAAVDPPEKVWKLIISVPLLVFRYDLVRPDGGQGHVPVKLAEHRQADVLGVAPAEGHMLHSTYRGAQRRHTHLRRGVALTDWL